MKRIIPYLILSVSLLYACKDEVDYGLGAYRVDMVKVESEDVFSLLDKSGTTLYNNKENTVQGLETGKRIMLNYTYTDQQQAGYDHVVKINGASWVHCDTVRTQAILMGDDPIIFESAWTGQYYLNFSFYINQYSVPHQIALMKSTSLPLHANTNYTYLELRHDAKNDSPGYRQKVNASYDLSKLGLIPGKDTIMLRVNASNYRDEYHTIPY